jgi:hypothetical protein
MAQRRSRSCAAPRPLRRHGRRSDASAQPQQQHYYELPIPLVSHPRSKFRGAFTKPSPSVDSAQSGSHGGTKKVNLFQRSRHPTRVPSTPALAHAPTTHQPHCAPTNAPALFKFGLAHNARAWNSFCGTGFCAIRVCISPSCLDTPHCALRVAAFNSLYPDPNHGAKSS